MGAVQDGGERVMAIKVTCEVQTYDNPAKPSIRVHSSWYDDRQVEIEVEGKRYTVMGKDLITAIEDAMCVNRWG
jgi:hypothetical protein